MTSVIGSGIGRTIDSAGGVPPKKNCGLSTANVSLPNGMSLNLAAPLPSSMTVNKSTVRDGLSDTLIWLLLTSANDVDTVNPTGLGSFGKVNAAVKNPKVPLKKAGETLVVPRVALPLPKSPPASPSLYTVV